MRSGSILPQFSSTIFFWRSKKGTFVGHSCGPPAPVSRLATTSGASSGVTLANILPSLSTETSGPALQSPMQPTLFTSTSFFMPVSTTSFLMASSTWSAPEERQPAAVQTHTRCWYFFSASRSVSAILRRSSMVMADAFLDASQQLFGADLAQHRAIHHHRRRETAGPQTAGRQHGKLVIGSGFAGLDAVGLLDGGEQRRGAFDIACGAGTHHARVLSFGLEGEEMVERRGAIDAAERNAQGHGDELQRGVVQIPEAFLHGVQRLDEGVGFAPVAARRSLDDFPSFIVRGQLWRAKVRQHGNVMSSRGGCGAGWQAFGN